MRDLVSFFVEVASIGGNGSGSSFRFDLFNRIVIVVWQMKIEEGILGVVVYLSRRKMREMGRLRAQTSASGIRARG